MIYNGTENEQNDLGVTIYVIKSHIVDSNVNSQPDATSKFYL